jgi:hypothetical protein
MAKGRTLIVIYKDDRLTGQSPPARPPLLFWLLRNRRAFCSTPPFQNKSGSEHRSFNKNGLGIYRSLRSNTESKLMRPQVFGGFRADPIGS